MACSCCETRNAFNILGLDSPFLESFRPSTVSLQVRKLRNCLEVDSNHSFQPSFFSTTSCFRWMFGFRKRRIPGKNEALESYHISDAQWKNQWLVEFKGEAFQKKSGTKGHWATGYYMNP